MISIHAPREGSDPACGGQHVVDAISIHAPREGSDRTASRTKLTGRISIHAPREGSDPLCRDIAHRKQFLSTLPARGATRHRL